MSSLGLWRVGLHKYGVRRGRGMLANCRNRMGSGPPCKAEIKCSWRSHGSSWDRSWKDLRRNSDFWRTLGQNPVILQMLEAVTSVTLRRAVTVVQQRPHLLSKLFPSGANLLCLSICQKPRSLKTSLPTHWFHHRGWSACCHQRPGTVKYSVSFRLLTCNCQLVGLPVLRNLPNNMPNSWCIYERGDHIKDNTLSTDILCRILYFLKSMNIRVYCSQTYEKTKNKYTDVYETMLEAYGGHALCKGCMFLDGPWDGGVQVSCILSWLLLLAAISAPNSWQPLSLSASRACCMYGFASAIASCTLGLNLSILQKFTDSV